MMHHSAAQSSYRWCVLGLAALTHTLTVAAPMMALPVLFKEISDDLGLSLVEVGAIWGIGSLAGVFTALLGGAIGDRFGTRRTLSVACVLAGVAGASRGMSNGFITLAATVLLFGFLIRAVPANVHKTCGVWFSRRQLGLANGVVSMGMASGFMLGSMISATLLSPWLGGWRNVLFFYGLISIAISIPWFLSRDAPSYVESSSGGPGVDSFRRAFSRVVRLRNVWLSGCAIMGIGGCIQGMLGYLPLYLREIGWPGPRADGALAAFHAISMVSTVPIALLSDRLGSRRTVLAAAALSIIAGVGLLSVAEGTMVWVSVLMAGAVRDGFMAIFMTMIIETEGVGADHAGTALGLVMAFTGLGGLAAPPIGNSLAAIDPGLPFAFWAGLAVLGLSALQFVTEGPARVSRSNQV